MALYFPLANMCDKGAYPSIAVNNIGTVVEVHAASSNSTALWCRVGRGDKAAVAVRGGKIEWGPSQDCGIGQYPSVAVNSSGFVVEVHSGCGEASRGIPLYYRIGEVNEDRKRISSWGKSHHYESGQYPVVALQDDGTVVVAHNNWSAGSRHELKYRIGKLDTAEKTIEWYSETNTLGTGYYPSIAINNDGAVVEMDSFVGSTLQYRVGQLMVPASLRSRKSMSIAWGNRYFFEREAGWYPSVALNNNDIVVAVHQARHRDLHARIGKVDPEAKRIIWDTTGSHKYSGGCCPTIGLTDDNQVLEEHETSTILSNGLVSQLGKL